MPREILVARVARLLRLVEAEPKGPGKHPHKQLSRLETPSFIYYLCLF
jgi:hypothetical protein